ncbi:2'-deoxycytidine 5'-triphosphate deaminase [Rhodoligotrophos ferricapiens]|uniref:2'-deoxycytidine 5'-triphosphate deaminase n=1 Tax=Rhodoligotrophos ferricapiens TaxID=3069264 RepID=UPI00315DBED1
MITNPSFSKRGILPSHSIRALAENGAVITATPLDADQIQPASLDLRLGPVAHRVRASFLPGRNATVEDRLGELVLHTMPLDQGAVLETGCVYIVPLLESLALPDGINALANPKSSTGRIDVFTRVIADHAREFDKIATGYSGPLYAEISPRTFPILVRTGSRLCQIRFRAGPPASSDAATTLLHQRERLVSTDEADINNGIALSVDLAGPGRNEPIGFRAKRHSALIDVDEKARLDLADYWEPLTQRGSLILDPNEFYILASKESVKIPPTHAAEMVPFNPLVGEFRVHYAGFFDPGFGHAAGHGEGSRAVLEVRSHEVPFILEDGQIVGRLIYEPLTEPPEQVYGQGIGSHYQSQGLKLSKHFRVADEHWS